MFKKIIVGAAFLVVMQSTQAGVITFVDRDLFNDATANVSVEDFNDLVGENTFTNTSLDLGLFSISQTGDQIDDANTIDIFSPQSGAFDVDGTNTVIIETGSASSGFGNFFSRFFSRFFGANAGSTVEIIFDSAISAFGADFANFNNNLLRTEILLDGITSVISPLNTDGFFGFTTDTAFTSVTFQSLGEDDRFGLDNLAFGEVAVLGETSAIPEPGTLALFGLVLLGLRARLRTAA